jgi:hypothetical protein
MNDENMQRQFTTTYYQDMGAPFARISKDFEKRILELTEERKKENSWYPPSNGKSQCEIPAKMRVKNPTN